MLLGTHFSVRDLADAELARMEWVETALNTWTSPDGGYTASFTELCGAIVQVTVREAV